MSLVRSESAARKFLRKHRGSFRLPISLSQVKTMRRFARCARTNHHIFQPSLQSPTFGTLHQMAADSAATSLARNHQSRNLGPRLHRQMPRLHHMNPADCLPGKARNVNRVIRQRVQSFDALLHHGRRNRVPEFFAQPRSCVRIRRANFANEHWQIHHRSA
jgi:hypothetical protein